MSSFRMDRRGFLKRTAATAAAALPFAQVNVSFVQQEEPFTFACISDSHIHHIRGNEFVRNWDRRLIGAVAEINLLSPEPDFVIFGGDLAQLGTKAELDHGFEMLDKLKWDYRCVMGEHDYYLDLGEHWSGLFGPQRYSFDHKGVHFVTLNSILTYDEWTHNRWPTAERRMLEMAGLDNPNSPPFMVGEEQREWLSDDLSDVSRDTPIIVFSHSPIQKLYAGWNFWTEDAEQVREILSPFETVTVIHGHVHQIRYNQIGNITFHAVMATAWSWPYPQTYAQADHDMSEMTVPMNGADPVFEPDATGWQFMPTEGGRVTMRYNLTSNRNRVHSGVHGRQG